MRAPRRSIEGLAARARGDAGQGDACAGIVGGSAPREGGAEVAHTGSRSEVARVGSVQEVVHARDRTEVAPAGDG